MKVARCRLSLLKENEVSLFLKEIQRKDLHIDIMHTPGTLELVFQGTEPEEAILLLQERFPTFFLGDRTLEEAIFKTFTEKNAQLGIAESCTGGAAAFKLTKIPGASTFFQGSIVSYSNDWKERFLHVRSDTLKKQGAVSKESAEEMVQGILENTNVDYASAITGYLGEKKSYVFIAIAKRGEEIDAGRVDMPQDRVAGMELATTVMLGALFRRVAHNAWTFS